MGELQDGITVNAKSISGTLYDITGYTGFSGDPAEQEGHYLVIHAEATEGATITLEIIGGDHGPVTLDEDGICICRIKNTSQKIKITASKEGYTTVTRTMKLTNLTLEA